MDIPSTSRDNKNSSSNEDDDEDGSGSSGSGSGGWDIGESSIDDIVEAETDAFERARGKEKVRILRLRLRR